jgi:hypothetical protein
VAVAAQGFISSLPSGSAVSFQLLVCASNEEGYASKVLFFYATRLFTSINNFRCSGEAVRRLRADDRVFIFI